MCRAFFIPPRQWERCPFSETGGRSRRFTPTYVGKMYLCLAVRLFSTGSPPHAWGKWTGHRAAFDELDGSPPRAWGKSWRFRPGWSDCAVHPHVRGENPFMPCFIHFCSGSPPRAWGKCLLTCTHKLCTRFTPTCVGKIPHRVVKRDPFQVHPHVRGENRQIAQYHIHAAGSPPRAWGKCRY